MLQKTSFYYYRSKDCIKNFCKDLKEHATKIINCEKKEMIPLTMEKINHIMNKTFAAYANKKLVLIIMIKML